MSKISLSPIQSASKRSNQSLKRQRPDKADFGKNEQCITVILKPNFKNLIPEQSLSSLKSAGSKTKKQPLRSAEKNKHSSFSFTFDSHPFVTGSFQEKQEVYCKGNYTLTSLNLACKQI